MPWGRGPLNREPLTKWAGSPSRRRSGLPMTALPGFKIARYTGLAQSLRHAHGFQRQESRTMIETPDELGNTVDAQRDTQAPPTARAMPASWNSWPDAIGTVDHHLRPSSPRSGGSAKTHGPQRFRQHPSVLNPHRVGDRTSLASFRQAVRPLPRRFTHQHSADPAPYMGNLVWCKHT